MSQTEAWIVTALGMGVVFVGLLLCVFFIVLFGRLARHISWGEGGHAQPVAPAAAVAAPEPAIEPPSEPVPGDVLAVIATVLQVEQKLYLNKPGSRLTIRRPAVS